MTPHDALPPVVPPSGATTVVVTHGVEETEAIARRVGEEAPPGTMLLLFGDLGAGKTAFVRGLAAGLGVDPGDVSSPTFTLIQEYRGRLRLQHVDLYRVRPGGEVEELGLDEFAARGDLVAIEWADRLEAPMPGAMIVRIADLGEDLRRIELSVAPGRPGAPDSTRGHGLAP
jgi:tRNA threonylcarbamoyladenosine biosynthesis protein TsaE